MKIFAIYTGEYGSRHIENIRANGPATWEIHAWRGPTALPLIVDYPEDYLPEKLPAADLILSFHEVKGVAELLPEIAEMTDAKSVLAPIDSEAWLPRGLARQLRGWLERMGVSCVTPKPLCSLTERDFGLTRLERVPYQDPLISEFARAFGQPELRLTIDPETRTITSAEVQRDAVCGCARFVAEGLVDISVDDAEEKAGLLHHHYPCLASMGKDPDFGDTLMHISGNVIKNNVWRQVKPFKEVHYFTPGEKTE